MNRENKLLSIIVICTMIMISWHHTDGDYVTNKHIVPQNVVSNIFASVVGACIVLLFDKHDI